jgi:serine/threonine-protein kinase BUR1
MLVRSLLAKSCLTTNSCVFAEMFEGRPILEGKSDLNQAQIIFELVGSPNEPGWSQLPGCDGVKEFEPQRGTLRQRFRK